MPGKRINRDVIISYTSESELELNDIDDDSIRFISRAAHENEGPARPQGRPRKGDSQLSPEELRTRAKRQKIAKALGEEDTESPLTSAVVGSTTSACASASLEQFMSTSDAAAGVVMKVATSSGNLKGTFVKKDSAKAFVAIGREIGRRTSDDASVAALRGQLKDAESAIALLREELAETKARLARVAEGKQKNPRHRWTSRRSSVG
ncbi:hypothetical protein RUM43_012534 [Polyplax serrata]|uniref:Uncharacterized protein n=1 Tax=Polyplax serrata TaxID=468196 RepID=A0AAN8S3B4_POLSC